MKAYGTCLPAFFAALLLFVSPSNSQGIGDRNRAADGDGRYSIQGRVYLPNGKPAQNAKVYINSADSVATKAVTDMNGMFQVGSLRGGNYSVTVAASGFPNETETVIIDRFAPPGRTFSVVLNLRGDAPETASEPRDPRFEGVPKAAAEKFRKAVEKRDQKDFKGAAVLFSEAIALYPQFAAAYFEKGSVELRSNENDKALASFVKAIELNPNYLEAKYSVGYVQYANKNYEVAAAVFADVLKQKRDFAEAFMYLGISLYYLKDLRSAEQALRNAISIKDDQAVALAHRFLGGMYAQSNRHSEAAAQLQKYLEMVPSAPDAERLKATIEDLKKKS